MSTVNNQKDKKVFKPRKKPVGERNKAVKRQKKEILETTATGAGYQDIVNNYVGAVTGIAEQQARIKSILDVKKEVIDKDPKLGAVILGYTNSLDELVEELIVLKPKLINAKGPRTELLDSLTVDDLMDALETDAEIIDISTKTAALAGTAMVSILSGLATTDANDEFNKENVDAACSEINTALIDAAKG